MVTSLGDRVLRSVAQSIQRIAAQVPTDGVRFAARIGREEFAVLIEGMTPEAAKVLANHIVEQIGRSPVHGDGRLIAVRVSVGDAHRWGNDAPTRYYARPMPPATGPNASAAINGIMRMARTIRRGKNLR